MSRSYSHISDYENIILEMRSKGKREKRYVKKSVLLRQVKDFITRYNRKQKKLASGIPVKPKGRPRKGCSELPPSVQQLSKVTQLQYEGDVAERVYTHRTIESLAAEIEKIG